MSSNMFQPLCGTVELHMGSVREKSPFLRAASAGLKVKGAMYIGPWQEYKLARLIQHQHQALARDASREARRGGSGGLLDASPASSRSGFSGLSTQSAPARVPGPSAQVRLNDYCDSIERCERRRWAARPRVPSGSSTASTRPYSSSSGSTRGQGGSTSSASSGKAAAKHAAGPKKPGKPPKAVSLEEQRRTRIRHMQRLYGLGSDESFTPSIAGAENFVEEPKQNSPESFVPTALTKGEDMSQIHKEEIEDTIKKHKVVIFAKSWCPFCTEASIILQSHGVMDLKVVEADQRPDELEFMNALKGMTELKTVPQIFVDGKIIPGDKPGCFDRLDALREKDALKPLLSEADVLDKEMDLPPGTFNYDLFVVGGGSGGAAAALEAARDIFKRVAVADFVKPSPQGTTWGVGGTCVNVGCIPKKLMHIAATKKEEIHDLSSYGFRQKSDGGHVDLKHDWKEMCRNIQGYIKETLNQGLLDGFEANGIRYYNKYATLKDRHTICLDDGKGNTETVTSRYILLAAGGRPNNGGYPGADEHCISSDDIFWLKEAPGKTLVVGAAYIALECAGFLNGLGYDTTVMVRSMLLRGFDRECVDKIDAYMDKMGVKFIRGCVPDRFEKGTSKKVKCVWKVGSEEKSEEFDTVLLAIGRTGEAQKLGLAEAGVTWTFWTMVIWTMVKGTPSHQTMISCVRCNREAESAGDDGKEKVLVCDRCKHHWRDPCADGLWGKGRGTLSCQLCNSEVCVGCNDWGSGADHGIIAACSRCDRQACDMCTKKGKGKGVLQCDYCDTQLCINCSDRGRAGGKGDTLPGCDQCDRQVRDRCVTGKGKESLCCAYCGTEPCPSWNDKGKVASTRFPRSRSRAGAVRG
eukprot:s4674_g2.t1